MGYRCLDCGEPIPDSGDLSAHLILCPARRADQVYLVVVNGNMHDASARVVREKDAYPLRGWERVWSYHDTHEAALAELPAAQKHVWGHMLPS